jgi:hypothetical protein
MYATPEADDGWEGGLVGRRVGGWVGAGWWVGWEGGGGVGWGRRMGWEGIEEFSSAIENPPTGSLHVKSQPRVYGPTTSTASLVVGPIVIQPGNLAEYSASIHARVLLILIIIIFPAMLWALEPPLLDGCGL